MRMQPPTEKLEVDKIRVTLERLLIEQAEATDQQARDFAFHMTDWIQDLQDLVVKYRQINETDNEKLFDTLLSFLLHVPGHVVEAAKLITGEDTSELLTQDDHQRG